MSETRACRDAKTDDCGLLDTGHARQCRFCGVKVRNDLVDHSFFGFAAVCQGESNEDRLTSSANVNSTPFTTGLIWFNRRSLRKMRVGVNKGIGMRRSFSGSWGHIVPALLAYYAIARVAFFLQTIDPASVVQAGSSCDAAAARRLDGDYCNADRQALVLGCRGSMAGAG